MIRFELFQRTETQDTTHDEHHRTYLQFHGTTELLLIIKTPHSTLLRMLYEDCSTSVGTEISHTENYN